MNDDKYWESLEYVSLSAALEWLQKRLKNKTPSEVVRESVINGCLTGKIKCRIKGDLGSEMSSSFMATTMVDYESREINRASFERWCRKMDFSEDKNKSIDDEGIHPRTERTYLNTIAALLSCITGDNKDDNFANETELREFLHKQYAGYRGVNKRTLAQTFAAAKKAIDEQ